MTLYRLPTSEPCKGAACVGKASPAQLYLLTNIDPDKLARRFLWWSIFQLAVFFGSIGGMALV